MHDVINVRPDPAHCAEDRLNEDRRLHETLVQVIGQRVQVRHIVGLGLEAGDGLGSDNLEHVFDVGVGAHERLGPGAFQVWLLPAEPERARIPVDHREAAVVHRSEVERAQLWLELKHALQPLLHGHAGTAAGGDAADYVAALPDAPRILGEHAGIRCRAAVLGVAGVQVQDGRARLRRCDALIDDLLYGVRQVRRHRRGVPGTGERAGNDDRLGARHICGPPSVAVHYVHYLLLSRRLSVRFGDGQDTPGPLNPRPSDPARLSAVPPHSISARISPAGCAAWVPSSRSFFAGLRAAGPPTVATALGYCPMLSTPAEAPEENSSNSRLQIA